MKAKRARERETLNTVTLLKQTPLTCEAGQQANEFYLALESPRLLQWSGSSDPAVSQSRWTLSSDISSTDPPTAHNTTLTLPLLTTQLTHSKSAFTHGTYGWWSLITCMIYWWRMNDWWWRGWCCTEVLTYDCLMTAPSSGATPITHITDLFTDFTFLESLNTVAHWNYQC